MNKIGVILCALKGENLPFYSTKYDSSYCKHCDLWDSLKVSLLGKVTTFLLKCDWYRKECTFKIHLLKNTALSKDVKMVYKLNIKMALKLIFSDLSHAKQTPISWPQGSFIMCLFIVLVSISLFSSSSCSPLCYSSDRQLSLDLVNVGRQRLDFLPMLEHSGTYQETAMHTGTFAQEIITLVHLVKG